MKSANVDAVTMVAFEAWKRQYVLEKWPNDPNLNGVRREAHLDALVNQTFNGTPCREAYMAGRTDALGDK